jgi:hypothetical protein
VGLRVLHRTTVAGIHVPRKEHRAEPPFRQEASPEHASAKRVSLCLFENKKKLRFAMN